jgi:hypothetical protein
MDYGGYFSSMPSKPRKIRLIVFLLLLLQVPPAGFKLHAQGPPQDFRLTRLHNLFSISARDADLKKLLLALAKEANIYVTFPSSLTRKITIQQNGIKLSEALERLLKGVNHFIIYSGPNIEKAKISEVFVLSKSKKPKPQSAVERRLVNRIKTYGRQIETLRRRLSTIDENSRRGQGYMRRIQRLEKNIERLERQLN